MIDLNRLCFIDLKPIITNYIAPIYWVKYAIQTPRFSTEYISKARCFCYIYSGRNCTKGLGCNKITGIDDGILCINEAKNTAIAKASLFNEVNVQKSKSKLLGYYVPVPKPGSFIY